MNLVYAGVGVAVAGVAGYVFYQLGAFGAFEKLLRGDKWMYGGYEWPKHTSRK